MKINSYSIFIFVFLVFYPDAGKTQINGFIKGGLNLGTINQEWWTYTDSIKYGNPLVALILEWACN